MVRIRTIWMIVMKVPREKMPRRTTFLRNASWVLMSMGKGVSILGSSILAEFRFGIDVGTYMMTSKMIVIEAMLV
jgi:hypothetical protein